MTTNSVALVLAMRGEPGGHGLAELFTHRDHGRGEHLDAVEAQIGAHHDRARPAFAHGPNVPRHPACSASGMPTGSKAKYTDKQKRQAQHIEQSEKRRGMSAKRSAQIGWATVNKQDGGGKKRPR